MTDPLELLWPLMDLLNPIITAHDISLWPGGIHQRLLALGFLREAESAYSIVCPECQNHTEEVIARPGPGGVLRYAIPCPELLRAIVAPAELKQWTVDFGNVAATLATQLQLSGKCTELVSGRMWRLGRWTYQGLLRDLLFARGLNQPDAIEFRRQITSAKRPVVFIALAKPDSEFWQGRTPPLIRLSEVAAVVDGAIALETTQIIGMIHDADKNPADTLEMLSGQTLSSMLDQKIRSAINSQLTDEQILQAYVANGSSARKAERDLKSRGFSIHHSTISRTVKKYQRVLRTGSSESIVRMRSSQRRDTPLKKRD